MTRTNMPSGSEPKVRHIDIQKLGRLIQMYSVHPEAMRAISTSQGDQEHIEHAMAVGQTEFLIIPMDVVPDHERQFVTETLHALRGKPEPKHSKAEGLGEKKYMLVHEPEAIGLLKNLLKDRHIGTEPKRTNNR
jgi:DNA-binding NtrC family response regulator